MSRNKIFYVSPDIEDTPSLKLVDKLEQNGHYESEISMVRYYGN